MEKTQNKGQPLEYQVFALCMQEKGAVEYFSRNLPEECVGFNVGMAGLYEFYRALISYHKATGLDLVDPVAFKLWLENETNIYKALGGEVGVASLLTSISNIELTDPESITALLVYRAKVINQLEGVDSLKSLLTKKDKGSEDSAKIQELSLMIRDIELSDSVDPCSEIVTANTMKERVSEVLDIPNFLPTQFKALNKAMGYSEDNSGFFRGAVHAILAASGAGKSTFTKSLVHHWLDCGHSVLYINYEEAPSHWDRIMMSQILGLNVYEHADKWSADEKDKYVTKYVDKLSEWGEHLMVKHSPDSPYFEDMDSWVTKVVKSGVNPDVIIIDTIQSMFIKGGMPRWQQYEEMMVRLEKMANELNCVLIITAQENANRMKEKREVVLMSDTGGSIAIQQKSSITMFLTKKNAVDDDETGNDNIMQIQIPKNRITGTSFMYKPPLVQYIDECKMYIEYDPIDDIENMDYNGLFDKILNGEMSI